MSIYYLLFIIGIICAYYYYFIKNSLQNQLIKYCNENNINPNDIQLPKGSNPLSDFYQLVINKVSIHDIFIQRVNQYGPVTYFWIGLRKFLIVADPEALKYILLNDKLNISNNNNNTTTNSPSTPGNTIGSPFIPSSPSTSSLNISTSSSANSNNSTSAANSTVMWKKVDDYLMQCIMSKSILTTEGDVWKEKRKRLSKAFRYEYLLKMVPIFVTKSRTLIQEIDKTASLNHPVEMHSLFSKITLDIIGSVGFKHEFNSLTDSKSPYFDMTATMLHGFEMRLPIPKSLVLLESKFRFSSFFKTIDHFWFLVRKILHSRRKENITQLDQEKDILSLILSQERKKKQQEQENEEDQRLNFQQQSKQHQQEQQQQEEKEKEEEEKSILADLVTFIAAGSETSSLNLTWTLYLLSKNREALLKCQQELDRVLGFEQVKSDGNTSTINNSKLEQLEYLTCCINEALRLIPPVTNLMPRVSADNDAICGKWFVPKGTEALCTFYPLHRSTEHWDEPEKFMPERWTKQNSKKMHPFQFLPFGGGSHQCIGRQLATLEVKTVLACLLHQYDFTLFEEVEIKRELSIRPKNGLKLLFRDRKSNQQQQ